jgi:hypothetical protein
MDRPRAADFYRRALAAFPGGKNAQSAAWRVAWTAYLDRQPEAADLLEAYVRQFPTSSYTQDALYWLGRSYERSGNLEYARGFYVAGATRFPLTYFGAKAAARLRPEPEGIGAAPVTSPVSLTFPTFTSSRMILSRLMPVTRSIDRMLEPSYSAPMISICLSVLSTFAMYLVYYNNQVKSSTFCVTINP